MKTSFRRLTAMAAGLAILAACSSEPTSPPMAPAAVPQASLLGTVGGLLTNLQLLPGLQRTSPLLAPITVTKTIGSAGGTLSIPQAGVTVTVPSGALASNTVITMTARAGYLVAYDFAPHGITFAKPLVFQQKLTGTTANLLSAPLLQLGYYTDPSLLTATGGLVSELLGGTVNLLSWTFTGNIKHFSGYMVGMNRTSDPTSEM
jgi:hypothetical protein